MRCLYRLHIACSPSGTFRRRRHVSSPYLQKNRGFDIDLSQLVHTHYGPLYGRRNALSSSGPIPDVARESRADGKITRVACRFKEMTETGSTVRAALGGAAAGARKKRPRVAAGPISASGFE